MSQKALKWNDTGEKALINVMYDNRYLNEHPISGLFRTIQLYMPKQKVEAIVTGVREVSVDDLEATKTPYVNRGTKGLQPIYLYKVAFIYNDTLYSISDLPATKYTATQSKVLLYINARKCNNYFMKIKDSKKK